MAVSDATRKPQAAPGAGPERPARKVARTSRRRLLVDRAARSLVTGGGLAVIASILGILVFILIEVWPLTRGAEVGPGRSLQLSRPVAAVLVDEYRTGALLAELDGRVRYLRLDDGVELASFDLAPKSPEPETPAAESHPTESGAASEPAAPAALRLLAAQVTPGGSALGFAAGDGRALVVPIDWKTSFDAEDGSRSVLPEVGEQSLLTIDDKGQELGAFAVQHDREGRTGVAAQLVDGRVVLVRREVETNDFTGARTESLDRIDLGPAPELRAMVLDGELRNLYAGTASGEIYWWALDSERPVPQVETAGASAVSATTLLIGHRALVVGQEDGGISVWFQVRQEDDSFRLTRIRDFGPRATAIRLLQPSRRNKAFLAVDADSRAGLYYSTSGRELWSGRAPVESAAVAALSPKADSAVFAGGDRLAELEIENRHPETTWASLFGKVWYEGYDEPEYVWQSTGGTDDFEPKLSLTPLLIGTLKGTFYSLLLAIPLGVLGAMFASQFLHPRLLDYIKPTVEIMAALPSVVLGFLAGLWLAPVLERVFPALILLILLLPLAFWLTGVAWYRFPLAFRNRFPEGSEVALYVIAASGAIAGALQLEPSFERVAFGGSFPGWLAETTGLAYDQRNAIVVGLAMGFAVIPIIFAISEDAFSNVPRNLVAGSLALGANRWQTVTRVVLPTASPGIFSAIMIGFGRAVGETMIVLMATGNTPVLSWSAFNGFRTLSANIAVEIPEAPLGGTLYRTLFLAGLLLFVLTFLVNTVAELVRQRLRRKFASL